jgi:glutamine synthetase
VKLAEYLKDAGLSLSAFAARAGVSEAAISRYVGGKRTPRPEIVRRIVLASGGRVQPNDLYASMLPASGEGTAAWLNHYPEIEAVDLLITDTCGIFRGKRIPGDGLAKVLEDGIRLPASIFALDINGENVSGTGLVWRSGDADFAVRPVDGRIIPVPWARRPMAQLLMTMIDDDGTPYFADPRQVLARVVKRFAELGLTPVVAIELEFYLLDRARDAQGRPQAPIAPASGRRDSSTQVYGLTSLDDFGKVLSDIQDACAAQDIPADAAVSEYAPGQFEINLHHVADPMLAADHAMLFKRTVKSVAAANGLDASFMAKPFPELAGNGLHIHLSLVDDKQRNVFDGGEGVVSDTMRHAIGGLMNTMSEAMAVFAPTANSYRRFKAGAYAPMTPSWGVNNRTVAIRVPGGSGQSRRLEHRVAGADANVYLALAALLAGAHWGIVNKVDPGPALAGNAYDKLHAALPRRWSEALDAMEKGKVLPGYFGERYVPLFVANRRGELAKFESHVSDLEYAWYLPL